MWQTQKCFCSDAFEQTTLQFQLHMRDLRCSCTRLLFIVFSGNSCSTTLTMTTTKTFDKHWTKRIYCLLFWVFAGWYIGVETHVSASKMDRHERNVGLRDGSRRYFGCFLQWLVLSPPAQYTGKKQLLTLKISNGLYSSPLSGSIEIY